MARVAKKRRRKPPATWAILILREEARRLRGEVRLNIHTVRLAKRRLKTKKEIAHHDSWKEELIASMRQLNDVRKALITLGD